MKQVTDDDDTVECPYCGEVFESDEEQDARTKEGVHRTEEHVNKESGVKKKERNNTKESILEKYKA